jgi:hypothetical protein
VIAVADRLRSRSKLEIESLMALLLDDCNAWRREHPQGLWDDSALAHAQTLVDLLHVQKQHNYVRAARAACRSPSLFSDACLPTRKSRGLRVRT